MSRPQGRNVKQRRRCVVCRRSEGKSELLRFVVDADGRLVWDVEQVMPGRGAYLHPRTECWSAMCEQRKWRAALKLDGPGPEQQRLGELMDLVRTQILKG